MFTGTRYTASILYKSGFSELIEDFRTNKLKNNFKISIFAPVTLETRKTGQILQY